eukprot:5428736-Prymnesium_polylepis.1
MYSRRVERRDRSPAHPLSRHVLRAALATETRKRREGAGGAGIKGPNGWSRPSWKPPPPPPPPPPPLPHTPLGAASHSVAGGGVGWVHSDTCERCAASGATRVSVRFAVPAVSSGFGRFW